MTISPSHLRPKGRDWAKSTLIPAVAEYFLRHSSPGTQAASRPAAAPTKSSSSTTALNGNASARLSFDKNEVSRMIMRCDSTAHADPPANYSAAARFPTRCLHKRFAGSDDFGLSD